MSKSLVTSSAGGEEGMGDMGTTQAETQSWRDGVTGVKDVLERVRE